MEKLHEIQIHPDFSDHKVLIDMMGIDPEVVMHQLRVDLEHPPVKQKRREGNGSMNEVQYPEWLANVVVVKKKNGKWRVRINFIDLNKACPNDPFPLPHIDVMVDAIVGHELLSFMDAFYEYHQILIHPEDQKKTTFITERGIYCYKVMPFELKNAGATYQRLVNKMFSKYLGDTMEVYIDDMLLKAYLTSPHLLSKPKTGEQLYVYLAVSGVATRYNLLEKLALALVVAARKLRPYFQCHSIVVVTNFPLRSILHKPELSGGMIKWAVELNEYDISYQPRTTIKSYDFPATNNEAEYEALVISLMLAMELRVTNLKVKELQLAFIEFFITQIPRAKNSYANALANLGSSIQTTQGQSIPLVHLRWPSIRTKEDLEKQSNIEVFPVGSDPTWMTPFIQYITEGPLLRCINLEQSQYVLAKLHEGEYGNHSGGRSLMHHALTTGYYWPTMRSDAIEYVKRCDKCQRFAHIPHQPPERLTLIVAPWPFMKWGMDRVGPLPKASGQFRVPKEIVTDNGPQFASHKFQEFCANWGIRVDFATPRHPQCNSQAEASNKTLIKTLEKRLEKAKGAWTDELPGLNWQELNYQLDTIDELRDRALTRTMTYYDKVARYFNKNIRTRAFEEGDRVLYKVFEISRELNAWKLGPNWEGPYLIDKRDLGRSPEVSGCPAPWLAFQLPHGVGTANSQ
ncbi:uncharacterized protein LOC119980719 [Tripterygium wilfordii]|uniref:uncharacterized protein LOC119980719 n=1 Tax=Tripterygium wilfordii TaxID=458696 RepID=UPI0018F7F27F|nr:uncharacterized protein LOC119980719 [Tripterygium wilfordii]